MNKINKINNNYLRRESREISGTRFKVIVVNVQEFECLMLMLYNRPKKFLKKIYVDWQTLVDFANVASAGSLEDERGVYTVLKKFQTPFFPFTFLIIPLLSSFKSRLAMQISLRKGDLLLRDIKYCTNIQTSKSSQKILKNIFASKNKDV